MFCFRVVEFVHGLDVGQHEETNEQNEDEENHGEDAHPNRCCEVADAIPSRTELVRTQVTSERLNLQGSTALEFGNSCSDRKERP